MHTPNTAHATLLAIKRALYGCRSDEYTLAVIRCLVVNAGWYAAEAEQARNIEAQRESSTLIREVIEDLYREQK